MLMDDLEYILISEQDIQKRVKEIAAEIDKDYSEMDLVLVCILKGGIIFLSDLTRDITIPHAFDMAGAESYGSSTTSSGHVLITKDVEISLEGRDVLLIEDIYDTGRTLKVVRELLQVHTPRSLEVCALLWKEKKDRVHHVSVKYTGFRIPDVFVVGYGLDFNEKYRNLRCIGVLKKEIYI